MWSLHAKVLGIYVSKSSPQMLLTQARLNRGKLCFGTVYLLNVHSKMLGYSREGNLLGCRNGEWVLIQQSIQLV